MPWSRPEKLKAAELGTGAMLWPVGLMLILLVATSCFGKAPGAPTESTRPDTAAPETGVGDTAGDSEPARDTSRDTAPDTSALDTSGPDTDVDTGFPAPECARPPDLDAADVALTDPLAVDGADDVWFARDVLWEDQTWMFVDLVWQHAAREGCPVAEARGDAVRYSGGCSDASGLSWEGQAVLVQDGSTECWSFTGLIVTAADGTFSYTVDGTYDTYAFGDQSSVQWDLDVHVQDDASTMGFTSGERTLKGGYYYNNGGVGAALYVATEAGDFVYEEDTSLSRSCVDEQVGSYRVTGSGVAEFTWDGDTTCDGCAEMTLDGIDVGVECP